MEFQITTDLSTALPRAIEFNFEEQKAWLEERLAHYNGLVVTDDTIKEGKEDRAKLNKLKTAIDTRRKEIKKEWNAPFAEFETKVKELIALIDQPINAIDAQLIEYETKRKDEKCAEITALYEESVPEALREIIPLEKIFSPQWLNATVKIKKVEEEMQSIVKRTNADMMVLDTVEDEYKAAVRETYIRTLDIEKAMNQRKALQEAAAAFKQREQSAADITPTPQPEIQPEAKNEAHTDEIHLLRLEFQLTKDQAAKLKAFLVENNITHRKI